MRKRFSFDQNGLLIKELDYFWRKPCLASVLLIDVTSKVIGMFFDRDIYLLEEEIFCTSSIYFEFEKFDKNALVFNHIEGKGLCYQFKKETGILIGSKQ